MEYTDSRSRVFSRKLDMVKDIVRACARKNNFPSCLLLLSLSLLLDTLAWQPRLVSQGSGGLFGYHITRMLSDNGCLGLSDKTTDATDGLVALNQCHGKEILSIG